MRLHPYLRKSAGGREVVQVVGRTIGECVDDLEAQFPGIKQRLCDDEGKLLSFYDIYVNSESSYPEEFAKPVKDGDELTVVTVIAGG